MTETSKTPVETILLLHVNDKEQTDFITSSKNRIIVQAPAGYGKTRTMVSKLAYILTTQQILNPKKILTLTFSVNAAYKIKKDVIEQLPGIVQGRGGNSTLGVNKRISVSNYHGFCRRVLSRYGYLLHEKLKNINEFTSFDDGRANSITSLNLNTLPEDVNICVEYGNKIKESEKPYLRSHFDAYNTCVLNNFVQNEYISFNAILTLTVKLFHEHKSILQFYQKLYPIIFVDEFQDTNCFGSILLDQLITDETAVYLMGDELQRIYGFIGAVPDIIKDFQSKYDMELIELKNNYRFKDNPQMLLLDNNIRRNAENIINPIITKNSVIKLEISDNQDTEAVYVSTKAKELIDLGDECKIAVLFRNGGGNNNTLRILKEFDDNEIEYFYGLFSDEDVRYKKFHFNCSKEFSILLKQFKLSKKTCKRHVEKIKELYAQKSEQLYDALIQLLEIFYERLFSEYTFALLEEEDKIILIRETFDGFGLKQYTEYVKSRIIISTIHGAKGLEWDYVIMPDMEQYSLPNWRGFCGSCAYKRDCQLPSGYVSAKYVEEISIFYVGFTRARREVFFSASKSGLKYSGQEEQRNLSCFLELQGIDY